MRGMEAVGMERRMARLSPWWIWFWGAAGTVWRSIETLVGLNSLTDA